MKAKLSSNAKSKYLRAKVRHFPGAAFSSPAFTVFVFILVRNFQVVQIQRPGPLYNAQQILDCYVRRRWRF